MDNIEIQGAGIVLLGHFNPAIFNPDWLARQEILSVEEVADSKVGIIHPELAQFEVGDLVFDVSVERFSVYAQAEPFVRLADIVADVFGDKLAHTPLRALGINYHVHFRVKERAQQIALGRKLAPLDVWGEWGREMESDDPKKVGGLASLTMKQVAVSDRDAGSLNVTVQPSVQVDPGVYVLVNDHFDASESTNLVQVCIDRITPSLERARTLVQSLIKAAEAA